LARSLDLATIQSQINPIVDRAATALNQTYGAQHNRANLDAQRLDQAKRDMKLWCPAVGVWDTLGHVHSHKGEMLRADFLSTNLGVERMLQPGRQQLMEQFRPDMTETCRTLGMDFDQGVQQGLQGNIYTIYQYMDNAAKITDADIAQDISNAFDLTIATILGDEDVMRQLGGLAPDDSEANRRSILNLLATQNPLWIGTEPWDGQNPDWISSEWAARDRRKHYRLKCTRTAEIISEYDLLGSDKYRLEPNDHPVPLENWTLEYDCVTGNRECLITTISTNISARLKGETNILMYLDEEQKQMMIASLIELLRTRDWQSFDDFCRRFATGARAPFDLQLTTFLQAYSNAKHLGVLGDYFQTGFPLDMHCQSSLAALSNVYLDKLGVMANCRSRGERDLAVIECLESSVINSMFKYPNYFWKNILRDFIALDVRKVHLVLQDAGIITRRTDAYDLLNRPLRDIQRELAILDSRTLYNMLQARGFALPGVSQWSSSGDIVKAAATNSFLPLIRSVVNGRDMRQHLVSNGFAVRGNRIHSTDYEFTFTLNQNGSINDGSIMIRDPNDFNHSHRILEDNTISTVFAAITS
jgi:hypothetical protein